MSRFLSTLFAAAAKLALPSALLALLLTQSGCYYGHLASGQLKIFWRAEPIEKAVRDPNLSADERELLELVSAVRAFASELGLHVDGQYTSYLDWPGDRIVTTIVRTEAGSIEVVNWWFPLLGQVPYKGYFDRERAEAEAERMRLEGAFDVCVSGVTAYSTLGWFDDPVTSPMLHRGAASLVETLLHELVHATAYLKGAADFNESVAQFIGQEAAIRFFEQTSLSLAPDPPRKGESALPDPEQVRRAVADRRAIAARTLEFRDRLVALEGARDRKVLRARAEAEAREALAAMRLQVLDPIKVAEKSRLSDACLALRGTYARDLPRHEEVFVALGGDLEAMIARLALWADEDRTVEAFFQVEDPGSMAATQPPAPPTHD